VLTEELRVSARLQRVEYCELRAPDSSVHAYPMQHWGTER